MDRFVFRHVSPRFHSFYKHVRHGAYDSERVAMYHRAVLWLETNQVKGSICEFGCASGESFLNLYFQFQKIVDPRSHFFLFDSFAGLPDVDTRTSHDNWKKGDYEFSQEDFIKRMEFHFVRRSDYTLIPGFYETSLTSATAKSLDIGVVSLIHIDCDLYESTRLALQFVGHRIQDGTVLLFDDYYCSKGNLSLGESGAFREWLASNPKWIATPWYDYSIHGKAFILHSA